MSAVDTERNVELNDIVSRLRTLRKKCLLYLKSTKRPSISLLREVYLALPIFTFGILNILINGSLFSWYVVMSMMASAFFMVLSYCRRHRYFDISLRVLMLSATIVQIIFLSLIISSYSKPYNTLKTQDVLDSLLSKKSLAGRYEGVDVLYKNTLPEGYIDKHENEILEWHDEDYVVKVPKPPRANPLLMFGKRSEAFAPIVIAPSVPLTTMSIVLVAHNEHKYGQLTVDAIMDYSHDEIVKEIILIDDFSDPPLNTVVDAITNPKLRIVRTEKREGLIKARMMGGDEATGDIIVFLDCHVKPKPDWEASFLHRINEDYRHVVVPAIPILDEETFEFKAGNAIGYKMMLEWNMKFHWFEDGNDEVPIMSGGLFAISRRWWVESGKYDGEMKEWGGENIEQSIRVWCCGGSISVARDSHIGHVFRKKFPYKLSNKVTDNKVRAVKEWFDKYGEYYYAESHLKQSNYDWIDVDERNLLKEQLGCNDFNWFVERFREVFTSRRLIPARTFQLRILGDYDRVSPRLPVVPIPPDYGPSEVSAESRGYCIIPILGISAYFTIMMEYPIDIESVYTHDEYASWAEYVQNMEERPRQKWIDQIIARNVSTGAALVPCHEDNRTLNFRHGGYDLDSLIYIGHGNNDAKCLNFSANSGANVTLIDCEWSKAIKKEEVMERQKLVFNIIEDTNIEVDIHQSNIEGEMDLGYMYIINNSNNTTQCLTGTIPTEPTSNLPPLISRLTENNFAQCVRWAEVNQIWLVPNETSELPANTVHHLRKANL